MTYDIADPKCDIEELFHDFKDNYFGGRDLVFDKWSVKSWISWSTQQHSIDESILNKIINAWLAIGYIVLTSKNSAGWYMENLNHGKTRSNLPQHSSQNSRTQRR